MKKILSLLPLLAGVAILFAACTKQQNCKCTTGSITTDFYDNLSEERATTWCDSIKVQMNNGNTPTKDSTFCTLHLKQKK